jgi:hypothetical protein
MSITGVVVVFKYTTQIWENFAELTATETVRSDGYGTSIAMQYDTTNAILTVAVGAPGAVDTPGCVFIHRFKDGTWLEVQKLVSDSVSNTFPTFGSTIALNGNVLIVGDGSANSLKGNVGDFYNNNDICNSIMISF